ncbi:protein of unknown function [Amycolatopsis xylanica]|uniref:DUF4383 domain-containing protein n=1 Tax=Amycolatopsis xylanica TaxID=589385 RepID=A0A1H3H7R9_9PSEU|nr:DUF4383 domain-containing protein [Amycolatopsis xylanica]SDY10824.1 protein of unknown function [Amycolatopsis xylanica]
MAEPHHPQAGQQPSGITPGGASRTPAQLSAGVVGVVFLLVGIGGFIPGLTTDYDQLSFAGHDSMAMLLGLFMVSVLHNIVHLLFGIIGLALARTPRSARNYLVAGGVIYLVLWIYGLVVDHDSAANFVPVNTADNWLHLGLGVAMIALGVATAGTTRKLGPAAPDSRR